MNPFSMEVTGPCPACRRVVELQISTGGVGHRCPACGSEVLLEIPDLFFEKGAVDQCLLCGERHLYRQRDFNQRTGCLILGAGAVAGLILAGLYGILWLWGVLLAMAVLDALLYRLVPDVVICYRCKAHHREMKDNPKIKPFDLQLADAIEGKMGGGFEPPEAGS
ncbi:MAG: hypothetical protein ACE5ID_08895 [Acidobacteriota bacterium]